MGDERGLIVQQPPGWPHLKSNTDQKKACRVTLLGKCRLSWLGWNQRNVSLAQLFHLSQIAEMAQESKIIYLSKCLTGPTGERLGPNSLTARGQLCEYDSMAKAG